MSTRANKDLGYTRPLLAYVIIKTLGSDWNGSHRLVELAEETPPFADKLLHKLNSVGKGTTVECQRIANIVCTELEPSIYKHQLTELYTSFVKEAKQLGHSGNSEVLTTFITFTVELCRSCVEKDRSIEVPSIHEYTCRLISESSNSCVTDGWERYIDSIPSGNLSNRSHTHWNSMLEVALTGLRVYDRYLRHTT